MSFFSPTLHYTCLFYFSYFNNFYFILNRRGNRNYSVFDKLNANSIFYYHTKSKKGKELPFNNFETSDKQYFSKYMWKPICRKTVFLVS